MTKKSIKNFFENVKKAVKNSKDGVTRAKVETVEVSRATVNRTKVNRTKVKRALVNKDGKQLTKIRFTDTDEIVIVDMWDKKVFEEMMTNGRPVEIIGFAYEEIEL